MNYKQSKAQTDRVGKFQRVSEHRVEILYWILEWTGGVFEGGV